MVSFSFLCVPPPNIRSSILAYRTVPYEEVDLTRIFSDEYRRSALEVDAGYFVAKPRAMSTGSAGKTRGFRGQIWSGTWGGIAEGLELTGTGSEGAFTVGGL